MPRSMARSRASVTPQVREASAAGRCPAERPPRRGTWSGDTTRRDSGASACISRWNSLMPVSMRFGWRLRHTSTAVPSALSPSASRRNSTLLIGRSALVGTSDEVLGIEAPRRAARPRLALPDRHGRLEGVDREPSGLEGLLPVGRRDSHAPPRSRRSRAARRGAAGRRRPRVGQRRRASSAMAASRGTTCSS